MKSEWIMNSEHRSKLEFEKRGTVLAGIIENPMTKISNLLPGIDEIVDDDLERHHENSDLWVIKDHWIVYNHIEGYWGVYYKKGHECVIDTRIGNRRFINQYMD
ncbi:hypothetical protein AB4672_21190 [Bacillus paralicheniformis]|uniref:hypothetical protein n=1 Tax=Bacillus paralicheniformis TaxID=1648923 RepID=UPI0034D1C661